MRLVDGTTCWHRIVLVHKLFSKAVIFGSTQGRHTQIRLRTVSIVVTLSIFAQAKFWPSKSSEASTKTQQIDFGDARGGWIHLFRKSWGNLGEADDHHAGRPFNVSSVPHHL
ncbi:hypothetical protein J057_00824 [Marinobacter nanhaiticus D15-8W]|uniref:Uncharacterized protein n=1 Tax=Marinobacter nanhaiticus D15-8W TaxID=626887 RepID=N6WAB1_9GAMM|nr:hypothetical protein J057_00824 [Marinobacter nanhaiticus D15-8W]